VVIMLTRLKQDLTMAEAARGPGGARIDLLVVADMVERAYSTSAAATVSYCVCWNPVASTAAASNCRAKA
jgi:hypothetical protein